ASRVVAEDLGAAAAALSCAQAAGAARPRAMARLRLLVSRLRFIDAPPRDARRTAGRPHAAESRERPHPAASYLRTMGRHRACCRHWLPFPGAEAPKVCTWIS